MHSITLCSSFFARVSGTQSGIILEKCDVGMSIISCWIHKCWQGSGAKHQGTVENGIFIKEGG
jgi:hypothetical protein